ncbi:MAG: HlyC/CorC family transporter [Verrucomicrobia bacterium]|nr:MAG: HlyC/CorC family transporter [Verrucomicrobiota bacterium]
MNDVWIIVLKLVAVLALVAANGFFVAAEFALVKVRDTQLAPLAGRGRRRAVLARHILGHVDPYLSACQLGITLASLALGWIGEPAFVALMHPVMDLLGVRSEALRHGVALVVGYSSITFLHIVVGEQAPKFLAIKRPLPTSLWVAYPLRWFHAVTYPFIWFLNRSSLQVLRVLGIETASEHGGDHSEEELRLMVATRGPREGESTVGRDLVLNAFDLKRRVVREVMTPRKQLVALNTEDPIAECLRLAEQTRYSRFPLAVAGNPDRTLGVVHFKDLVALRDKARTGADLQGVARPLIFVPPTARLETLLRLFLERKLHFSMVVDEFGGTLGLVTLENVLEELVGQIQDEFDHESPRVARRAEGLWEIDGSLPLFELAELVGEPIVAEDVTTVSGWVTQQLGGFPRRGGRVAVAGHELVVEDIEGLRVSRLVLRRLEPGAVVPPADGSADAAENAP